jgi:tetratricopeptide (TPR) repeat protein
MSDLLIGLLSAVLSAGPPAAAGNPAAPAAAASVHVVNTNDPVETAYRKLLEDDDAAEKEVLKWSDDADAFARAGAGDPRVTLNARIRQRLAGIKAEYEDFILQHPNHANARLAYGSFLNDTHDEEGAVAQWDKARQLEPTNPAAWNNLANYYGHRSPVKKAFEYYGKAIELDGRESVYYHNLAVTVYLFRKDAEEYYHLTEQQVFDKSLALYRKAIELDPDNFVLFSDYAESFYGTNPPRWKEGLAAWTEALKIAHDDVEREGVYIHLARINLKLGHFDEARRSLDVVTNAMYATLKNRITRNLNEALRKAATNAPAPPAPARPTTPFEKSSVTTDEHR